MDHTDDIIYDLIAALAAVDDVEPSNLHYDVSDYINPAALGNLFATEGEFWECSFDVPKHEVTVTHTGEVFIDGSRRRQIGEGPAGQGDMHAHVQDTLRYRQSVLTEVPAMLYRCENERNRSMEFVNEGCKRVTGYEPTALLIGGVSYGTDIIHANDRDQAGESITEALRNEDGFSIRYRIETAENGVKEVWDRGVGVATEGSTSSVAGLVTAPPTEAGWPGAAPESET